MTDQSPSPYSGLIEALTRPIVGIANRTAEEAFDIMADRIRNSAAIRDLEAENARLREALEPFGKVADEYSEEEDDDWQVWIDVPAVPALKDSFRVDQFRKARAALSGRAET